MNIQRIAAFSADGEGGNPAGVVLLQEPLPQPEMESIAAEVGYSETAFRYRPGRAPSPVYRKIAKSTRRNGKDTHEHPTHCRFQR